MHEKVLKYSVWWQKPHLEKTESEDNSVVGSKGAHKQYSVSLALQLSSLPPTLVEHVLVKEPAKSKCDSLFNITSYSCVSISHSLDTKKEIGQTISHVAHLFCWLIKQQNRVYIGSGPC